mmetsp:Transcript_39374/g.70660  ORF Transcript_39374/g.70660 Transcript_39374/m.70660 type:complete len:149 (+) Transcript_39374:637-1083(+)
MTVSASIFKCDRVGFRVYHNRHRPNPGHNSDGYTVFMCCIAIRWWCPDGVPCSSTDAESTKVGHPAEGSTACMPNSECSTQHIQKLQLTPTAITLPQAHTAPGTMYEENTRIPVYIHLSPFQPATNLLRVLGTDPTVLSTSHVSGQSP